MACRTNVEMRFFWGNGGGGEHDLEYDVATMLAVRTVPVGVSEIADGVVVVVAVG